VRFSVDGAASKKIWNFFKKGIDKSKKRCYNIYR